jgi:hypothetical protein
MPSRDVPDPGAQRLVKGSHIIQAQQWIDDRLAAGTFKRYTAAAGDRWQLVLPFGWYEVEVLQSALEHASNELGLSVEDITAEIATANAEQDLTSIYRAFLRLAQPRRVLSFTPRLWTTYVSFGSATAIKNDDGHYIGQGDGFPEHLVPWVAGCWRGFIPATIVVAGGTINAHRILKTWEGSDGTHSVQFEVHYH